MGGWLKSGISKQVSNIKMQKMGAEIASLSRVAARF
jgi:hypothetical protein